MSGFSSVFTEVESESFFSMRSAERNINYVTDLELLKYLAKNLPEYDFEIAGKIDLNNSEYMQMKELLLMTKWIWPKLKPLLI